MTRFSGAILGGTDGLSNASRVELLNTRGLGA